MGPQAGWYPDPSGALGQIRWWDGASWSTEHVLAAPSQDLTGVTHAAPPYRPEESKGPLNRFAVASFVLSLFFFLILTSLLGIVLGFLARRDVRRRGGKARGLGLANAGIAIGVAGLVGTIVLANVTYHPKSTSSSATLHPAATQPAKPHPAPTTTQPSHVVSPATSMPPASPTTSPTPQGLGVTLAQAQADFASWNQTGVGYVWGPPSAKGPELLVGIVVSHGIRVDLYGPSQSDLSEVMASFTGGSGNDAANAGIVMLGEAHKYGGNDGVSWLSALLDQADNQGASSTFADIVQERDFGTYHLAFSSDPSDQLALDVTLTSCGCAAF